jgi:catechol 2,3-dioxygenase-like lactoylglutathione lyase family enzyme
LEGHPYFLRRIDMQTRIDGFIDDYDRGRLSRRQLVTFLTGLAGAYAISPGVAGQDAERTAVPAPEKSTFVGTDLNHIALRVTDIGRSRDFYQKHLGLAVSSESRSSCFLRCREKNFVALFRSEKPGMHHYCYSIEKYDPDDVVETLKAEKLEPRRSGNRVYFDDPDGLEVQVAAKSHDV